jgi:hypothetical protein
MIEDGVLSLWGSGCWRLRIVPHYDGQHERRLITHESSLLTAVIEEGSGSPYPRTGETIIKGHEYNGTQVYCDEAAKPPRNHVLPVIGENEVIGRHRLINVFPYPMERKMKFAWALQY